MFLFFHELRGLAFTPHTALRFQLVLPDHFRTHGTARLAGCRLFLLRRTDRGVHAHQMLAFFNCHLSGRANRTAFWGDSANSAGGQTVWNGIQSEACQKGWAWDNFNGHFSTHLVYNSENPAWGASCFRYAR